MLLVLHGMQNCDPPDQCGVFKRSVYVGNI